MNHIKEIIQKYYRVIAVLFIISNWYIPTFMFVVIIIMGNNYIGSTDIPFEYIGKEPFNLQESKNIDGSSALYGSLNSEFWAYIADNEEEYRVNYGKCGMSQDLYQSVDFEDYIMVMSQNRPLAKIRVMKNDSVWENSVPYSYPQFVFDRKEEENMVYYYKVYRIDTTYKKKGQEIVSRLKLWMVPYYERTSDKYLKPEPMIESWGPFKKWKWSFDIFNHV